MSAATLKNAWLPKVKSLKVPLIVGAENLVNPAWGFGLFAVVPDHVALGAQAAGKVYEVQDNGWQVLQNGQCDPPLSVFKIINLPLAKSFGIKDENLTSVDKIAK